MRYKQKLIEVEAVQFTGQTESIDSIKQLAPDRSFQVWHLGADKAKLVWGTGQDECASLGDYVVKNYRGEIYCSPKEVFEDMFEMVLEYSCMTKEEIDATDVLTNKENNRCL